MPKYLITGGAGFIGSHLVDRLSPSEAELVDQPLCGGQTVRRTHRTNLLSSLRDNICPLRLFTVYRPRQRPDLAIRKFAELIMKDQPIPMYGDGESGRDYTYVDDVVDGIIAALTVDFQDSAIYNLGNGKPLLLRQMIDALEIALHRTAAISL